MKISIPYMVDKTVNFAFYLQFYPRRFFLLILPFYPRVSNDKNQMWKNGHHKKWIKLALPVTFGIKWLLIWSDFWYEVTFGMKWLLVWSDFRYKVTSDMKWLLVWSDFWFEVTFGLKWLLVWSDTWYEMTPDMKWP